MTVARIDYPALDADGNIQMVRGTPAEGVTLTNLIGVGPLPDGWTELRNEFGKRVRILVVGEAGDGLTLVDRRPWSYRFDGGRARTSTLPQELRPPQ